MKLVDGVVSLPFAGGIDRQIGVDGRPCESDHLVLLTVRLSALQHIDRVVV